jgi:ribosomal protein S12 methylthiotransferase accessory factor
VFVSLDFTVPNDTAIERSSAGLAIGTTEHEAIETALLEAIERDAIGAWRRVSGEQKALHRIRLASIPFDWFREWSGRARKAGAHFRVFAVQAIDGTPVCIVYLSGSHPSGPAHRIFMGTAAHGSPETALFKAMAEALQSRLTLIAGSRDDMLPSLYDSKEPGSLLGAAGLRRPVSDFSVLQPANSAPGAVASRLATLGYDQVAVKRLSPFGSIPVVKVFVPGLGSLHSVRRPIK